jgi:hypothetical protein
MRKNLGKLLEQKTSNYFRWKENIGWTKQVVIEGDHPDYSNALLPQTVIDLCSGGQDAMRIFAEKNGHTGLDSVAFFIEPGKHTVWCGSEGDDYEVETDVFRLIAYQTCKVGIKTEIEV